MDAYSRQRMRTVGSRSRLGSPIIAARANAHPLCGPPGHGTLCATLAVPGRSARILSAHGAPQTIRCAA